MTNITDWLSLAAALVSAVGGAFAARAAFLSARSAREAQQAADAAERRASLRDIATAAAAVLVEEKRVSVLVDQVKQTHRALSTLSGASRSSRLDLYVDAAEQKRTEAGSLAEDAKLFAEGAKSLEGVPPEEIDRIQLRQTNSLKKVQTLREDLEREHDSVEAQCAQIRDSMDRARLAR